MNVLILCHPKIIKIKNDKIINHWYNDIILTVLNKYNIDINLLNFETVDVLSGGNFKNDCFSEEFQMANHKKYDMIIMPDCAGNWFKFQQEHNEEKFRSLLLGVITMLKDNSLILIDKLIYPEFKILTEFVLVESGFEIIPILNSKLFGNNYNRFILASK